MKNWGFKYNGIFGKLKDDKNNVSGNYGDNFQDKMLKNIIERWSKDDKHDVNILSLKE